MFVEERMYTLHPGKLPEYLKLYTEEGMAIQTRILPAMVGYYTSEIGATLNLVVHMWAYEDLKQRSEYRAKMQADPGWQAYAKKIQPLIQHQESRILNPAPFFAAKLEAMIKAGKGA
jgi:L-rhamnose mutarotase